MTTLTALRRTPVWRFVRHYLAMVAAMLIGMAVLGPLESLLFNPFGWAELRAQVELRSLIMATNMTVAMVAWMRFRGHGWAANAEMAAAMYGSFVVLFPPLRLGLLSPGGLMMLGHVLMFLAMAAVMLRRRDEYTGHQTVSARRQPA
jgi:hypothetical protein